MSITKLSSCFSAGNPVFLAPMAGVTDAPFRKIISEFGISATVSEMASSEALVRNSQKTFKRLVINDMNTLNSLQILGDDPGRMAESAKINEELGADVIDINMGCPVRKIILNHTGAALMKDEKLAESIVRKIVDTVKIPVTVKMRLGWDFDNLNFLTLAQRCENAGASMITVHCRTRSQMYSGTANWGIISALRNHLKIPYLCNGDIKDAESAQNALKASMANGIMIGRGALGRPWVPSQILNTLNNKEIPATPTLMQQLDLILRHFQLTCEFYGEKHGIRIFRKHFCWYSAGLSDASKFRETINRADDISFIKQYVKDFYLEHFKDILTIS